MYSNIEFIHNHGERALVYKKESLFYEVCSAFTCLVSVCISGIWVLTYLAK